jgi:hypothetical protein
MGVTAQHILNRLHKHFVTVFKLHFLSGLRIFPVVAVVVDTQVVLSSTVRRYRWIFPSLYQSGRGRLGVFYEKSLLIWDTPEHVDSENIILKIGPRSLLDQLLSKRDF